MGARPLGRVIQEHIKQPLAEEVLFGKLKKGGTVKITVKTDENGNQIGLDLEAIEDGPVTPKPEPAVVERKRAPRKPRAAKPASTAKKPPEDPPRSDGGKRGLVPKVPLKTG
jgi:ATP-dependent Clp protease ATP-binding subunit ClpA